MYLRQWPLGISIYLVVSQVLCLANGERIGMGHGMRILFEVDNLAMASPATVSRCGMVYMVGYPTLIIVIIGRKCVVSRDIFLQFILATL